jgi:2-polyprenyl-3-methyl-5-hydroxy-6-metoxy-1,4-benzoquinol methylase
MNIYSNPSAYWEARLTKHFDLVGVGHAVLGPYYNQRMYVVRLRALERVLAASGIYLSGQDVLEIGCGIGFYTQVCRQQRVASYTGVDITRVSVQNLAHRYPEFCFIQADVGDPGFAIREQFDVILAADVLFHIVDDNRFQSAIANLSNSLRPGAHLILSDVLSFRTAQTDPHCRLHSLNTYQEILAQHGLTVRQIEPIFAVLQPPVAMPGTAPLWRIYALLWRYGFGRLAHWRWFDRIVPALLDKLDERFFLPRAGTGTPNSKWLVAVKSDAL